MSVHSEISDRYLATERLKRFGLLDADQEAFARISDMLRDHAHHLATAFIEHFISAAGIPLEEDALAAQIDRTAQYSRGKFSPPIDETWIARIEKAGELQFKTGASNLALLSALSSSHRAAATIISEGADDEEDRRYLLERFMRVSALEVEILVTTLSNLEKSRFRRTIAANAKTFEESIADIIQASNKLSAEARVKASASVDAARALLNLSDEVTSAASQSTAAMAEAAEKTGGLENAISAIDAELSSTLERLADLSQTANCAEESALTLTEDTRSIERILKQIRSIADQAKVLSLNALVEAASAGEAGQGFGVVANEMKELATRTEQATGEIGLQVSQIRQTSEATSAAHRTMREQFDHLTTTAGHMRSTLDTQSLGVKEITRRVEETAIGADNSSQAVTKMKSGIESLSAHIGQVSAEVTALDGNLVGLRAKADAFTATLKA